MDNAFIAFAYGDWHSIGSTIGAEFYRVANGGKYEIDLIPTLNDTFKDDEGRDGQVWLGSTHKNRTFKVDFAFKNMDSGQMNSLISAFSHNEVKELVFAELPFKAYDAKVTGTPVIKAITFDGENGLVFHGEGTVNFTCYQPYAHTPREGIWNVNGGFRGCDSRNLSNYSDAGYVVSDWRNVANLSDNENINTIGGKLPAPFKANGSGNGTFSIPNTEINFTIYAPQDEGGNGYPFGYNGPWSLNSENGALVRGGKGIYYEGITIGKLPVGHSIAENEGFEIINNSKDLPFWYY